MSKFLVKFRTCEQVSPDDWEMISKEKIFEEDTKLATIRDWVLSKNGFTTRPGGYKKMSEIFLSEPE